MPTRRLTISVPQPCQENWSSMTPQNQGRFCQSCAKTVVDFTAMADAEVVEWLLKKPGNTCGRFRPQQLERELLAASAPGNQWTWKAVTLGLAAWLSTKTVEGKGFIYQQLEQQRVNQPSVFDNLLHLEKDIRSSPDSSLTVSGKVLDATTGEPVAGVAIVVKGKTIGTSSDSAGNFRLEVPSSFSTESTFFVFSFIGFLPQEVALTHLITQPIPTIRLTVDTTPLMGETFIIKDKWYSPRGLFYTVKNLFR